MMRIGVAEGMKMKINSKDFRARPGKGQTQRMADESEALLQVEKAVSKTPGRTR